ncbi:MAG: hypothetical protein Terrestrivirus1_104 [Terrestrivirus sp.]|uniref:Uncharacterized protein n=1 Tax=Terrestrivirus sp. TaxID=2487775 RepID=A0A3G4ZK66_9VIRU|nr:MAG: hypothetical protein Terrestrivirus1_104 [Terrestrivirus sp.]
MIIILTNDNMSLTEIDPDIIYFTHSRIRQRFTGCNKTLDETLNEIKNNVISVHDLPRITVYYDNKSDAYFSQNNRRLWVYKYCKKNNLLNNSNNTIGVLIKPMPLNKKYSKETCSLNAKICLK